MRTVRLLILAGALVRPGVASAAWPPGGLAVAAGPGIQSHESTITSPDPSGGSPRALTTWVDFVAASPLRTHVFAQLVNGDGQKLGPPAGAVVDSGPGVRSQVATTFSGTSSFSRHLVAMLRRVGADTTLRVHRVFQSGIGPAWPDTGVVAARVTPQSGTVRIVGDAQGGAIVAWIDARSGNRQVRAQRLSAAGAPQWTANGIRVAPTTGAQEFDLRVSPDGAGGALLGWFEQPAGDAPAELRLVRLQATGTQHPSWPAGGRVIATPNAAGAALELLALHEDATGGVYAVWRNGTAVFVSRFDVETSLPWAGGSRLAATTIATHSAAGGGGITLVWSAGAQADVMGTRLLADGSVAPGWVAGGKPIATGPEEQDVAALLVRADGSTFVAWFEPLLGNDALWVTLLTPAGNTQPGWPGAGAMVDDTPGFKASVALTSHSGDSVFVAWSDGRDDGYGDVYLHAAAAAAQGLDVAGTPREGLGAAVPNPSAGRVRFTLERRREGAWSATILDVAGRRVRTLSDGRGPAGRVVVEWDGRDDTGALRPPGAHFLQVVDGDRRMVRRFIRIR